ncbi:MAG TPA: hypothetical protein VL284_00115 [Thermoanaerobaculia bacterium]|nr:hypothetical protein [Thermoanaerobaculia bacterium]
MIPLTTLWLPILLSAVFVFLASNILHMLIPAWHRGDYGKLPDEAQVLKGLSSAKTGQYLAPHVDWGKMSKEERDEITRGPMAFILMRNPAEFSMAGALISWFVFTIILSILIAYVGAVTLARGTNYLEVFRVVGTAGILAYSFGSVSEAIWYGKPWSSTIKDIIDGIIYGLVTAGTFGWLWPR